MFSKVVVCSEGKLAMGKLRSGLAGKSAAQEVTTPTRNPSAWAVKAA
jgi:hypothetical protein